MGEHPGQSGTEGWRERATGLAIVAAALLVQWPLYDRAIVPMDEGHLAAAADWMLDGKRLYTDIHTGIFPGIYLITSGLFSVFGRDLMVTRLAAVVVNCGTALVLWRIALRTVDRRLAPLPSFLYLLLLGFAFPVLSMFNYSTLALAFGLAALLFLLRYLERAHWLDGAVLGFFVAAAALTKQNFGGLVFVSLWIGLTWVRGATPLAAKGYVATLLPIGIAGASLTLITILFFVLQGNLGDLLDSTLISLGGSQLSDFNNPIPPLLGPHPTESRFVFLYTPPPVFGALIEGERLLGVPMSAGLRSAIIRLTYGLPILVLAATVLLLFRRGRGDERRRANTRVVGLFGLIFALGIFPSAIWSHLAFVLPPIALLATMVVERIDHRLAERPPARWVWRATAGIVLVVLAAVTVDAMRAVVRWNPDRLEVARAEFKVSPRLSGLLGGAVDFVEACAAPGEPILALPDIPILYFLTDRPNPSKFDLAIPGRVDGALIANRAKRAGVRCVVFNPQMYPEFPPFKQLFPQLADHLEREFRGERVISGGGSRWIGLVRRPTPEARERSSGL